MQIVARVIETGLHKMDTLGFDVTRVVSAMGTAPLPPTARSDMRAIGRTNDCILYGGQARYVVAPRTTSCDALAERLPASASADYGTPFYDIFKRYDNDFYKIDPMLFSPAEVWLTSATSGRTFHAGRLEPRRAARVAVRRLIEATAMQCRRFSARGTGWHTDELCRALAERGHVPRRVLPYESAGGAARRRGRGCVRRFRASGARSLDADAVLARIIPSGSLEQIIYRVDALHWIEERGVPVMNSPRAIERSVDKFYTTALLQEAGLPTPETVVCESAGRRDGGGARDGRRDRQADLRLDGPRAWCASAIPTSRFASSERSSRCAPCSTCSAPSITAAATSACSSSAAACSARSSGARRRRVADQRVARRHRRGRSICRRRGQQLARARGRGRRRRLRRRRSAAVARTATVFVLEVNGIPGWQGLQQATGLDVAGAIVDASSSRA